MRAIPTAVASLLAVASALTAQASTVVPALCSTLPGNAALALPLRWSHGTMQVFVDAELLPANFVGQAITGLTLRRPTLPGDGAYAPLSRTLTVRGGFQAPTASMMIGTRTQNRPPSAVVLFGPAVVTTVAAPAPGPATTIGGDLLHVPFSPPLPVTAGTLYLELETGDAPLQFAADHWVDGFWHAGADGGYAVPLGDGSCTTRAEPTRLVWTAGGGAVAGATVGFEVHGAPPTFGPSAGFVLAWAGIDPESRPPGPGYLGYGASLGVLDPAFAGCHQWAPFDVAWVGPTSASGTFATSLVIPGNAAVGVRLGLQAAWLDGSRPVLPLSFSNGLAVVVGPTGVAGHCSTLFFPGGADASPWGPFRGQMPVLRLEH